MQFLRIELMPDALAASYALCWYLLTMKLYKDLQSSDFQGQHIRATSYVYQP